MIGPIVLILRLFLAVCLYFFLYRVFKIVLNNFLKSGIIKSKHPVKENRVENSKVRTQLLPLAGIFLFLFSVILTLSPAVRVHSMNVALRWNHWLGFLAWLFTFLLLWILIEKHASGSDPILFSLASLLTGWGILTIFRLSPDFGLRQSLWLLLIGVVFAAGLRINPNLNLLRKFKYVWLIGGLIITSATLLYGTDPGGGNERAWLGCCGFYFQPSEPLKLLLVIFLAAYFYDHRHQNASFLRLLAPTGVVFVFSLVLLIIQHDLGTASIIIFLYTIVLYFVSGKKRILFFSGIGIILAGILGYFFFDVVRQRVDTWFNPWLDPGGKSFQIIQSLLAIASGGLFGRGAGLGSPGLVPVAISDFIFVAIGEELGLIGTIGLLAAISLFVFQALTVAVKAPDDFLRTLMIGLIAYIGGQSLLIIAGNLRFVPLTGVTLPFISYGGSSLLTSLFALFILLLISSRSTQESTIGNKKIPYSLLSSFFVIGVISLLLSNFCWSTIKRAELLQRNDNFRPSIADRYVLRGGIFDKNHNPIDVSLGEPGNYERTYLYLDSGSVIGYTNSLYRQAGLEATLNPYLRGLRGNSTLLIWWDYLVYGQPPPGLDVRLSIDLNIQKYADQQLGENKGAIIIINAMSGEILAMVSHPTFNPCLLVDEMSILSNDPDSPLINRAVQGNYPIQNILSIFYRSLLNDREGPQPDTITLNTMLGFYASPLMEFPIIPHTNPTEPLLVNPLQVALDAAAYSNLGIRPIPRLTLEVNEPGKGWVSFYSSSNGERLFSPATASQETNSLLIDNGLFWGTNDQITRKDSVTSWSIGGTFPYQNETPVTVVVVLENNDIQVADIIRNLLIMYFSR